MDVLEQAKRHVAYVDLLNALFDISHQDRMHAFATAWLKVFDGLPQEQRVEIMTQFLSLLCPQLARQRRDGG